MRASHILRQICSALSVGVHAIRFATMLAAVDALVRGGRLTLTAIGRHLRSDTAPKHRIKRIDRLLGNPHMHREILLWYSALTQRLMRGCRRPIVLIDWTQTVGRFDALVAAVPFLGRAIPIYAEVHPHSLFTNRKVHQRFLIRLELVLPRGARPIIVADAGFKTPFFNAITERGWDFVIRLRGRGVLKERGMGRRRRAKMPYREAHALAVDTPQSLGEWAPYAAGKTWLVKIVLGMRPRRASRPNEPHYERSALEPWLLATTLSEAPARVVAIYAMRMQIEEMFRDTKSARLGWALEHSASRDPHRQAVLVLIASIALATTLLTGAAIEEQKEARRFQANTISTRRVQSLYHLGLFILSMGERCSLTVREIIRQRRSIATLRRTWIQLLLPFTRLRNGYLY